MSLAWLILSLSLASRAMAALIASDSERRPSGAGSGGQRAEAESQNAQDGVRIRGASRKSREKIERLRLKRTPGQPEIQVGQSVGISGDDFGTSSGSATAAPYKLRRPPTRDIRSIEKNPSHGEYGQATAKADFSLRTMVALVSDDTLSKQERQ
ncbi:hypothetical protein B0H13DRAFT_2263064 [Mycena leptocephala]|nr:hypothetical protein B0H13DRAFT_2263064 [Mycena leptocephala]